MIDKINTYLGKDIIKKLIVVIVIILFLLLLRSILPLLFVVFLVTYITNSINMGIKKLLIKYKVKFKSEIIVIALYSFIILIAFLFLYKYIPMIVSEAIKLVDYITDYIAKNGDNKYVQMGSNLISQINIKSVLDNGGKQSAQLILSALSGIGTFFIILGTSMILSLGYIFDKDKLYEIWLAIKKSRLKFVCDDLEYVCVTFTKSIGSQLIAQLKTSLTSSTILTIGLAFLGFNQLLGLFVLSFLIDLMPAVGIIVVAIPVGIIALSTMSLKISVISVIWTIIVFAIESIYISPRYIQETVTLPFFLIILLLIISNQLMGIYGLLIGVPFFVFILQLFEVKLDFLQN